MFNTKLISVRIDEDTLQMIDSWCKQSGYVKRSRLINEILYRAMKDCFTQDGRNLHTEKIFRKMKMNVSFE